MKRISEECKLFKTCKDKACLRDLGGPWSIELCYDLNELMKMELIKRVKMKK